MTAQTRHAKGTDAKYGRRIAVQVPQRLFDEIKRRAVASNRSISAQAAYMLDYIARLLPKEPQE